MIKRKLNLYTFHRNIAEHRFDHNNTLQLISLLNETYEVNWVNLNGSDNFMFHDVVFNHGSIMIFEFDDTKEFKLWDVSDHPLFVLQLHKSPKFLGASVGQYNKQLFDDVIEDVEIRKRIVKGPHFETMWQLGITNYDAVQEYRNNINLDKRLLWRGSLYTNNPKMPEFGGRAYIPMVAQLLASNFAFGAQPVSFDDYINEAAHFKLILCSGVGGGYTCGDYCFRDAEMYGLGIPTIRPQYAIDSYIPLIPNHHYISVDTEFDEKFRYKHPEKLAQRIADRYQEVIDDEDYLKYIADNARNWYIETLHSTKITKHIKESLGL